MEFLEWAKTEFRSQPITVICAAVAAISTILNAVIGFGAIKFANVGPDLALVTVLAAVILSQSALGFTVGSLQALSVHLHTTAHIVFLFVSSLFAVWLSCFAIYWLTRTASGIALGALKWFQFGIMVTLPSFGATQFQAYFQGRFSRISRRFDDGVLELITLLTADFLFLC
jgi:hypothetical protein